MRGGLAAKVAGMALAVSSPAQATSPQQDDLSSKLSTPSTTSHIDRSELAAAPGAAANILNHAPPSNGGAQSQPAQSQPVQSQPAQPAQTQPAQSQPAITQQAAVEIPAQDLARFNDLTKREIELAFKYRNGMDTAGKTMLSIQIEREKLLANLGPEQRRTLLELAKQDILTERDKIAARCEEYCQGNHSTLEKKKTRYTGEWGKLQTDSMLRRLGIAEQYDGVYVDEAARKALNDMLKQDLARAFDKRFFEGAKLDQGLQMRREAMKSLPLEQRQRLIAEAIADVEEHIEYAKAIAEGRTTSRKGRVEALDAKHGVQNLQKLLKGLESMQAETVTPNQTVTPKP